MTLTCRQTFRPQRNEPFCQPYGNRRLLHCVPKGTAHHDLHGGTAGEGGKHSSLHEKEVPAWEACGKVVLKERQDYWEFVVRVSRLPSSFLLHSRDGLTDLVDVFLSLSDGQSPLLPCRHHRPPAPRSQTCHAAVPPARRQDRFAGYRRERRRAEKPVL